MAWPSTTSGELLSGDGIKTLAVDMWDRDAIAASVGWTWGRIGVAFSADTSWATKFSAFFRLPAYAEATAVITLTFLAKATGGADNADFRLTGRLYGGSFSTGGTTTVSHAALTTLYTPHEVTLAIPASPSWAGQVCEFTLDAQHTTGGGTWNIALQQLVANMRVVPISP